MSFTAGVTLSGKIFRKDADHWKSLTDKNLSLFLLYNKWIKSKQEGKTFKKYFDNMEYKSAAIYGMSYVGERLLTELKDSGVEVRYAVDLNSSRIYSDIEVYSPKDNLPKADVMIVTAVYFFDEIYNKMKEKVTCPIVSIEDLLYSLDRWTDV